MNMFKTTSAKTVEEYLDLIPQPRQSEVRKIHAFIVKNAPNLKPFIISGMIGYGPYRFKYTSGREGKWSVLALASQKNYISFYVCIPKEGGLEYIPEKYKKRLPKASIGKSCIRFKKTEDIDLDVLKELIKTAFQSQP